MSFLTMPIALKLVLILTVLAAGFYDLRVRRIPNWVNLTGALLGLVLNTYFEGLHRQAGHGLATSAGGMLIALCVYVPLYALKGMGAGDVKLMAAIGAIVGPGNWFNIFLVTALLGGVASLTLVLVRRKWGQTMLNISTIVTQLAQGKPPAERASGLSIHNNQSLKMPHGAIIASGVCLFLAFHWNA